MLDGDVIGNRDWTRGLLSDTDVSYLEALDCEIRGGKLPSCCEASLYEQLVEKHGDKIPTHCEHGVPLYENCATCRAFLG